MESQINSFRESLRYNEGCDVVKLLKIQRELEKDEINKTTINKLIKDLSECEKRRILQMYVNQIELLNDAINNYRCRIINERKRLHK